MKNFAYILAAASVALLATPASAAPTGAATPATAKAQIVKALTLTAKVNLDFGTIVYTTLSTATSVSMTTGGAITCGSGLVCSGTPVPATYNVTGTNNQVVKMYSATSTLTGSNGGTLTFTPTLPAGAQLTLNNSGAPGSDFNVGGSIAIPTTVVDGVYSGNMNVTVDYN